MQPLPTAWLVGWSFAVLVSIRTTEGLKISDSIGRHKHKIRKTSAGDRNERTNERTEESRDNLNGLESWTLPPVADAGPRIEDRGYVYVDGISEVGYYKPLD